MEEADVIAGIMKYRKQIHEQDMWNDPVKMSNVMVKLEVYNNYLSDFIAPAHKQATEEAYIQFKAHEHRGATKAKEDAKGLSVDARERYERLKYLYSATDNLLSRLQSRLRVIDNTIKNRI